MSPRQPVVRCEEVTFRYRRRTVFEAFDLTLPPGVTGLLGPNGAGKSTLLSVLSTRRGVDAGAVTVLGHDADERRGRSRIRARTGLLTQRYPLVGSMRACDVVTYAAWTQGVDRAVCHAAARGTMERIGVAHLAARRVRTLSGGQRQMVGLAATLVHEPELLFLDEPTAGLDPQVRMALRRVIRDLSGEVSIVLSTHLVDDVLAVCDHVVVVDDGVVRFEGSPTALERVADDDAGEGFGSRLERAYEALLVEERGR